jgi:hypothetical protein
MQRAVPCTLLALTLLFTSCADRRVPHAPPREGLWGGAIPAQPIPPAARAPADNVVLVTLDGVRWQEIFGGLDPKLARAADLPSGVAPAADLIPNLHRLFFEEGVVLGDPQRGEGIFASGPYFVSLPSYIEIMTGAPSGCGGNDCRPEIPWTIAEEVAHRTPGSGGVAVFSSWERIARSVPGSGVFLRAGRPFGDDSTAFPGNGEYRPDRDTAALGMEHLKAHKPRFLWIALGDTDEWAHRHDYRGYLDALRFADTFIGDLSAELARMGEYGARTTLLVTTDHGRDENFADHGGPASAGVWLMARGEAVPRRGVAVPTKRRYLRDIAPTISALLGQPVGTCAACGEILDEVL